MSKQANPFASKNRLGVWLHYLVGRYNLTHGDVGTKSGRSRFQGLSAIYPSMGMYVLSLVTFTIVQTSPYHCPLYRNMQTDTLETKLLLTSSEAAAKLGISKTTIHRLVKAGKLECIKLAKNSVYFTQQQPRPNSSAPPT
ncbi:MAG: helix-turn-helix domain-containing protein [bacterium]|nr:helix-turn-helix domain-containing protein [bacterium]